MRKTTYNSYPHWRILIFLLLSFSPKQGNLPCNYIDPNKLNWGYYLGRVNPDVYYTAYTRGRMFYFAHYKVRPEYNLKDPPRVCVAFVSDSSWVNYNKLYGFSKESQKQLLTHEKMHYIVTIIHAKKLKRDIAEFKFKNANEFLQAFDDYTKSITEMNRQYDDQTKHGTIPIKQKEWEEKIYEELAKIDHVKLDSEMK